MTDDDILHELDCEFPLPRAALLAAAANRETLAPRLIDEIDRFVADPSNAENRPQRLFFAFHLFGEWRETAAYRSLCHVMRMPPEDLRRIMDGALTETGHRVLASVFDGDPQPLYDLVLEEDADEFARAAGCEALAMVTARGRLPLAEAERFLRDGFDARRPENFNYVWSGWQEAIALLGLESLQPLVRQAFRDRIDPTWLEYRHFAEDLRKARADGSAALKGGDPRFELFGDTIGELADWHCFSESPLTQAEREEIDEATYSLASKMLSAPQTNPYRHVGRNDPCPCGSGLKFKRCHGKA